MQNRQFTITMLAILISNVNICLGTEVNLNPDSCKVTGDSMEFCSRIDNPFLQLDFNSNTKAGLFDFIEDAWNVITSPLKPVWGYYEEGGQRITGPYTIFQHSQGIEADQYILRIRQRVQNTNDTYFKLYEEIYKNAMTGTAQNCSDNSTVCHNANTAKNAAFVYLVGIKILYDNSNNAYSTSILRAPERNAFKTKAENIIKSAYAVGLDNGLDDLVSIPIFGYLAGNAPLISINLINGIASWNKVYWRSRELVSLLQAFDMLKWAYYVDGSLPNEQASSNTRIMADRLKDRYIVPLYRRATGAIYPYTNNNYGLMAGCALGMSAIV